MIAKDDGIAYNERCTFTNKTGRAGAINTPLTLTNVSNQETTMATHDSTHDSDFPQSDTQPTSPIGIYELVVRIPRAIDYESGDFQFSLRIGGSQSGVLLCNGLDLIYMHEVEVDEWASAMQDAIQANYVYEDFYALVDNADIRLLTVQTVQLARDTAEGLLRESYVEYFTADQHKFIERYLYATKVTLVRHFWPDWPTLEQYIAENDQQVDGYVYLISSPTGAYKIGRAKDPNDRMRTFGVQLPFEVQYETTIKTRDARGLERSLHMIFNHRHINGEWYQLSNSDAGRIRSLGLFLGGVE